MQSITDSKYDSRVSHTKCKNFPEFFYKVTKSEENLVNMFHERFVKRLKKEHDKLTRFMNKLLKIAQDSRESKSVRASAEIVKRLEVNFCLLKTKVNNQSTRKFQYHF